MCVCASVVDKKLRRLGERQENENWPADVDQESDALGECLSSEETHLSPEVA